MRPLDIDALTYLYGDSSAINSSWVWTWDDATSSFSLSGAAGNNTLIAVDAASTIYGLAGDDVLFGRDGDDKLYGGAGNDILGGGSGNNELYGEGGNDRFLVASWSGASTIFNGGNGIDTLDYSSRTWSAYVYLDDCTPGSSIIDVENLIGGWAGDRLYGNAQANQIDGGSGKDKLYGGSGNDKLFGNDGNDILKGDNGADKFYGGNGKDRLFGGAARDKLDGGKGNDRLKGDGGNDKFVFKNNYDKDKVLDFQNNKDTILLDDNLWNGTKSVSKVLNQFGTQNGSDFVLDFGGGDILTIKNTTKAQLHNDIDII